MGNDRLNTTEVNADLAALLQRATPVPWDAHRINHPDGTASCSIGNFNAGWVGFCSVWVRVMDKDGVKDADEPSGVANAALIARAPELAAEVLRLTAEAREAALQYLSDTGQLMERIDELTAANIALAADNARMSKRVEDAHRIIDRGLWLTDDAPTARAWLAGGAA